jgi:Immunoglobulin-like domain of bacterial spore germination
MPFRLNHPNRFAIVPNPVLVAGFGTAFEGEARIEITEGHDSVEQALHVGGTGTVAEFQAEIDLSGTSFLLTRLFIDIFEFSAEDGSRITHVHRPVFFGPGIMSGTSPLTIAPFIGWFEHVVRGHALRHRAGCLRRREQVAPHPRGQPARRERPRPHLPRPAAARPDVAGRLRRVDLRVARSSRG